MTDDITAQIEKQKKRLFEVREILSTEYLAETARSEYRRSEKQIMARLRDLRKRAFDEPQQPTLTTEDIETIGVVLF